MANDPGRTEKATPKRKQQAREEGSVLRVPDLDATVSLWANFFLFLGLWGMTLPLIVQQVRQFLQQAGSVQPLTEQALAVLAVNVFTITMKIVVPFLGANLLINLANQFMQHGFHISFKPITPKFSRLNPASGFSRLFSPRSLVELGKSLVKFAIVAGVAYFVLRDRLPVFLATLKCPLSQSLTFLGATLFVLYRNVLLAMLVIIGLDFLYQRYQFEKGMRMTKQEVKDEAKDAEGSPEVKGRQKSLMLEATLRRILTHVPKASVVITNPTHFAVALKYDDLTAAPICVAKGVDFMAFRIRERAKSSHVTVVENPALARAIYWSVGLDEPIPPELYQAVAQVLAYVYRLKGAA